MENAWMDLLLDENSRCNIGTAGACFGMVGGWPVCCASFDGAKDGAAQLLQLLDFALKTGAPAIIRMRGQGDAASLFPIYRALSRMSGAVPLLAMIAGEMDAAVANIAALCDIRVHEIPGAGGHCCDVRAADEEAAVELVRTLLDYLPSNCAEEVQLLDASEDTRRISLLKPGMTPWEAAREIADTDCLLPLGMAGDAQDAALGFARVGGRSAGLLLADEANVAGLERFVRLCDCYSLPIITISKQYAAWDSARFLYVWATATTVKLGLFTQSALPGDERFDLLLSLGEDAAHVPAKACRARMITALDVLSAKRDALPPRKHGNTPW